MKILFVMLRAGYIRNYEETLELLAQRGHTIHLAFSRGKAPKANDPLEFELAERLATRYPGVSYGEAAVADRADGWSDVARLVRHLGDFGRFLHPRFRDAVLLRKRAQASLVQILRAKTVPRLVRVPLLSLVGWLGRRTSALLANGIVGLARRLEQAIPPGERVLAYVSGHAPDVVLATPVVDIGSDQADYFKAARKLGIPSGVCVASWDNLSNKGVLRVDPEAVFVWNETQRREAAEMHGIPPEVVVVTGAQRFDQWFVQRPSRTAAELAAEVGLDPELPYLLYLCSSPFIAPDEVSFVERWARAVRDSASPELARVGILVRPHPQNAVQWQDADLSTLGNVAVWPRAGQQVVDAASKADFFDSIAHSRAVVGINTSAQIEAAILGKSVFTVLAPEFAGTQEGTLHYHYLRYENGGFLHEAATLPEHVEALEAALGGEVDDGRTARFVESFVRPLGLDVPGSPVLADGIEKLATTPLRHVRRGPFTRFLALVLRPVAAARARRERELEEYRRWKKGQRTDPRGSARRRRKHAWSPRRWRLVLVERLARSERPRLAVKRFLDLLGVDYGDTGSAAADQSFGVAGVAFENRLRAFFEKARDGVVLGPYAGDVATEVLYWLPFLRWAVGRFELDPGRLVAVSRRGAGAWYAGLAGAYRDAGPPEAGAATLEPAMLDELFADYRRGAFPIRLIVRYTAFARLPPADHPVAATLPRAYVAAAFDFSPAFPETPENVELACSAVERLAETVPVAVLAPPASALAERLGRLPAERAFLPLERVDESETAAATSAVVARAQATLGGIDADALALSVSHGVPAYGVYSDGGAVDSPRLDLLIHVARALETRLAVVAVSQLDFVAGVARVRADRVELLAHGVWAAQTTTGARLAAPSLTATSRPTLETPSG